jgi:ribosome maturation protein Sdo1
VGKGEFAKKKDMTNAFGNLTEEQIIMEILNKGEF